MKPSTMKKVLVVDDEPDVKLALKIALEENGFEVNAFDDPIIALDNFRKGAYDLLILDIKMPKMHGFELYREIRKIDNKVKVCFLTAGEMYYGDYSDIFNENQFIRKPIANKDLISKLNEMIKHNNSV
ncbi:MAG TPA: response regulator [Nitrososphaeraceae archaeon]|nr:response regulator [Nitrososphaeraceae archaeon]